MKLPLLILEVALMTQWLTLLAIGVAGFTLVLMVAVVGVLFNLVCIAITWRYA